MYSLNAPVPGAVATLATDLGRRLPGARARTRGEHTLVCKRLGRGDAAQYHRLEARAREALTGTPPFQVRVTDVDVFESVPRGRAPVVYLTIESPELRRLHARLCESFDPIEGVEGDDYVPHVTVARGGSLERAREVCRTEIDPIEWTVDELVFWDAEREQSVSSVCLPV